MNFISMTPLHCAISTGQHSIVELLLEKGADTTISDQKTVQPPFQTHHFNLHCPSDKTTLQLCFLTNPVFLLKNNQFLLNFQKYLKTVVIEKVL